MLIEALTDNRNRTVSEVRNILTRGGGSLGTAGSVAWLFESRGIVTILPGKHDPEEIALLAIDGGADDVNVESEPIEVYTEPQTLEEVRRVLEKAGVQVDSAEVSMQPKTTILLGEKEAIQTLRMVERLEELDDIQKVYFNADFDAEVLEKV